MKQILLMLGLCFFAFGGVCNSMAQTPIERALQEIEQNNTVLSALRSQVAADKAGNKTGIYLENPEFEYHYLWGNTAEPGNRVDISASQSFDFPTAYHYKKKVSDGKNQQVDLKYLIERNQVLLEAKQTCNEWIYANHYAAELQKRMTHARSIAEAYEAKYAKGEVNVLDRNKAKLSLLNMQKSADVFLAEKDRLAAELQRLNGGKPLSAAVSDYAPVQLPVDFDSWFADVQSKNLDLQYLQQETALSRTSEKLQRSMNLPKFSAGYMSEKVASEQFQGVMVGITIPLWENKNTVKQIKSQTLALEATETDAALRFRNETKASYDKAQKLSQVLADFRSNLSAVNSSDLLKKALDSGEISLIDYLTELSIYYEAVDNLLETERDYQQLVAELQKWEM